MSKREAAIYAGYIPHTASHNASMLLRKPKVQAYLQELMDEQKEKFAYQAERLALELSRIAFSNVFDMIEELKMTATANKDGGVTITDKGLRFKTMEEIPDWIKPVVKRIRINRMGVDLELYDKIDAIDKLGRHIGFFEKDNEQNRNQGPVIYLPDNNRGENEGPTNSNT